MKSDMFKNVKEYQKVNHYPGSFQIGRKDRLWRNMFRMQATNGRLVSITILTTNLD